MLVNPNFLRAISTKNIARNFIGYHNSVMNSFHTPL